MPQTLYLLFFAAHLAFILTNLYGWLLKWFYRSRAYSEEFGRLYLAQRLLNLPNKYKKVGETVLCFAEMVYLCSKFLRIMPHRESNNANAAKRITETFAFDVINFVASKNILASCCQQDSDI